MLGAPTVEQNLSPGKPDRADNREAFLRVTAVTLKVRLTAGAGKTAGHVANVTLVPGPMGLFGSGTATRFAYCSGVVGAEETPHAIRDTGFIQSSDYKVVNAICLRHPIRTLATGVWAPTTTER